MPYTPATAIAFAQRQSGRYGDGQCWTLVEAAITGAGGRSSIPQTPNFGPNVAYVWGDVVEVSRCEPGMWCNTRTSHGRRTRGSTPPARMAPAFRENSRTEGRGLPHHSGLVVRVISPGMVEVIEQNIPPRSGPVQTFQIALSAPATTTETTRSGTTVTVTTISHSVSGIVRCYRPIAA